jgi:predicted ABC-type ATPase
MDTPYIIVIAGPNGVGKSTFGKWYLADLADCAGIVDPDAIARELMELPEQQRNIVAGRLALERIDSLITERVSFAIETTLSGKTLAAKLMHAESAGYYVILCLLQVPSVATTIQRVSLRVNLGGHNIALADQLRRFDRSYRNFHELYMEVCHEWTLYDAEQDPPRVTQRGNGGFSPK